MACPLQGRLFWFHEIVHYEHRNRILRNFRKYSLSSHIHQVSSTNPCKQQSSLFFKVEMLRSLKPQN